KSNRLRQRILAHFRADLKTQREMNMALAVRRIQTVETIGELGALLLENRDIKALSPIHNQRQRCVKTLWSWHMNQAADGFLQPVLESHPAEGWRVSERVFGPYRSKGGAGQKMKEAIRRQGLCAKALGMEHGPGPCFARK